MTWTRSIPTEAASAPLAPLLGDGAWPDLAPAGAPTWGAGASAARLDYLLVAREDAGAVLDAAIAGGDDVARASDHRPVILDLRVRWGPLAA